jgi:hypothetical protein
MIPFIDYKKWFAYCELRSQKDKFLKAIQEMRHCDWAIHKRLKEANRVYILPARGQSGKSQLELYTSLMNEGRDVTVIRAKDIPKLDRYGWDAWGCALIEQNERAERFGHWVHELYKDYGMRNLKYDYKPIVRPYPYIIEDESTTFVSDMWLKYNPYLTRGVSED